MIDYAVVRLNNYLRKAGIDPDQFVLDVNADPDSPWINLKYTPKIGASDPSPSDFSMWKRTGSIFRVVDGEVQEPAVLV